MPDILFDLAQAYRVKQDCRNAREYYQRYLQAAPDGPLRAKAQSRLVELRACVSEPAPTPVEKPADRAANQATDQAAKPEPKRVEPPPPATAPLDLKPASVVLVASAPKAATSTPVYKRWWLWTTVGAVVAGGAIAVTVVATRRPQWSSVPDFGPGAH
jgi:hypothetical protein